MMTDKTKTLHKLGAPVSGWDNWLDYRQYGFDENDVPALLALVKDHMPCDEGDEASWGPIHAMRALAQLADGQVVAPLLAAIDHLASDLWLLNDLPTTLGKIGESAIEPLRAHLLDSSKDENIRSTANEALQLVAKYHPAQRERVIQCFSEYMSDPDLSTKILNGLVIGSLIDLDAIELIDDIRLLFEKDAVDISCAGDIEEVEIAFGIRTERSTPKPDYAQLNQLNAIPAIDPPDTDDTFEVIDFYLMQYARDDSILDVSEMDGFFTALACSPETILPSRWMPAIWGGEQEAPEWHDTKEFESFSGAAFTLYNHVMQSLNKDYFEALFLEREVDGKTYEIVDEWCHGFLRGMNLWSPLSAADGEFTEEHIQAIQLFATEAGFVILEKMDEADMVAQQKQIEPDVRDLFEYFYKQRKNSAKPVVNEAPKIGRNDPCPCGSGKKFKKCCLH